MLKQVIAEVMAILGRPLRPVERLAIRANVAQGLVNPYDNIVALRTRGMGRA